MKIISMFTAGLYEREIKRLGKSLDAIGIEYHFDQVTDHGSWHHNVSQKADTISKAHTRFPNEKLLWVDADAYVHEDVRPFLEALDCDFAAFWLNGRLQSGTMLFSGSHLSRELAIRWVKFNAVCRSENGGACPGGGQANLHYILDNAPPAELKTLELPPDLCYIFDLFKERFPDAVPKIEHLQASREANFVKGIDPEKLNRRLQRVKQFGE